LLEAVARERLVKREGWKKLFKENTWIEVDQKENA
jgi:hypothetical protein